MQFAKQVFYNPLLRRSFRRIVWKSKRFLLDVIPECISDCNCRADPDADLGMVLLALTINFQSPHIKKPGFPLGLPGSGLIYSEFNYQCRLTIIIFCVNV